MATPRLFPARVVPRVRRGWGRAVALASLCILATLVALEVGFRLLPQAIPTGACRSSLTLAHAYCDYAYRYDRPLRLGYVFKSGYTFDGMWNPADPDVIDAGAETCQPGPDHTFHYTFRADEHGFVGNESPWQEQYDLVVTGDSFTRTYAPVWWLDLVREQTGLSALNLGMEGWGTLAEVEAVRQYGLDKSPRWVILLYFEGNDLFEVGEYARRRASGLDWRTYQLYQVSPLERWVVPHVVRYWAETLWAALDPPPTTCRYPMTVTTNTHRFETIFFNTHIAQLSWSREQIVRSKEWRLAREAILALRDEVEDVGGQFLLVYVPAKEHLYWSRLWDETDIGHFLELTVPLLSYEAFSDVVDDQMTVVERFAAKNAITFLNLTGPFWEGTMAGTEYYNYADLHWNEAGNRLVAQWIVETLARLEAGE